MDIVINEGHCWANGATAQKTWRMLRDYSGEARNHPVHILDQRCRTDQRGTHDPAVLRFVSDAHVADMLFGVSVHDWEGNGTPVEASD
jgi:hypothetical protein